MRTRWVLVAIWFLFAARLAYYSAMLPLWEGFDEWSHFAAIRLVAFGGGLLPPMGSPVPRDVEASMELTPLPWQFRDLPWPAVTHDVWWQLPEPTRQARRDALHGLPSEWQRLPGGGRFPAYETYQAPLYYWLMAPVMRLLAGRGLIVQVMTVRWLGALLASFTVWVAYLVARDLFTDRRVALGCAAVVAAMPELAIVGARVGNDCLAILLFSVLIWLGVRVSLGRAGSLPALGLVWGLGLLTKAYFLAAAPAVVFLLVRHFLGSPDKRRAAGRVALALGAAGLIGVWWYIRMQMATGTLTGLAESAIVSLGGPLALLRAAVTVPWAKGIDSILFAHLYVGGWSWLTVRGWMYHLFYAGIAVATVGLLRGPRRPPLVWLLAVYLSFWLAQLYDVVILFVSRGVPTSMGYYLCAVVAAEIPLAIAGLRRVLPARSAVPLAVGMLALLDLYAMHAVSIPYYTGLIRHKSNGALANFHWADLRAAGLETVFHRLSANVSEPWFVTFWLVYVLATVGLVAAVFVADER